MPRHFAWTCLLLPLPLLVLLPLLPACSRDLDLPSLPDLSAVPDASGPPSEHDLGPAYPPDQAPPPDLAAPTCDDRAQDGDETGVDCGGPDCAACADGQPCTVDRDCRGGLCRAGTCATPSCGDHIKDGKETDVDCGGPDCPACADGLKCAVDGDCKGMVCNRGVCQAPLMCAPGTNDCDGDPNNGCEALLYKDAKNCGQCGNACPNVGPTQCIAARCVGGNASLVIHTEVHQQTYSDVGAAVYYDGRVMTLDLPTLQKYPTVLVFAGDAPFLDADKLGDVLADYVDRGGRVVVAMSAIGGANKIGGRFGDPNGPYWLLLPTQKPPESGADALGKRLEPASPLLYGVDKLAAQSALRSVADVNNNATVVAEWGGGQPLVVRGEVNGHKLVLLNLYPPSSKVVQGGWTGDGHQLITNALYFE